MNKYNPFNLMTLIYLSLLNGIMGWYLNWNL